MLNNVFAYVAADTMANTEMWLNIYKREIA